MTQYAIPTKAQVVMELIVLALGLCIGLVFLIRNIRND